MKSFRSESKGKMDSERRKEILEALKKEKEDRKREIKRMCLSEDPNTSPTNLSKDKYTTASSKEHHIDSITRTNQHNRLSLKSEQSPTVGGEVYNNNIIKESFKYSKKINRFSSDKKDSAQSNSLSFLLSQRIPKDSPMKSFIFDKNSKLAQEIRNKYKANPLAYNKTTLPSKERNEQIIPSARHYTTKRSGSITYMNPTASAGIRNSRGSSDLPIEVLMTMQRKEAELRKTCTFKPNLNLSQYDFMGKKERRARLYQAKIVQIQKREQLKRQQEDAEFEKHCTFKPERSAANIENKEPVDKRLYEDANKRLERLRNEYKLKELEHLKGCTFKPNVTRKSAKGNTSPLCERFKEVQRERTQSIQKLKIESEVNNKNLTFKPNIMKRRSKTSERPVVERLFRDAEKRIERSERTQKIVNEIRAIQFPFMPRLHGHFYSTNVLDEDKMLNKSFKERQELHLQRKQEESKYKEEYSFKPQINSTSQVVIALDPKRFNETQEQKYQRLSQPELKQYNKVKEEIEIEFKKKFTHHPTINDASRSMIRQKSIKIPALEKEEQECTFKPKINPYNATSRYSQREKITTQIKEREQKKAEEREQKKRNLEYEEMKECTFKPSTTVFSEQKEPISVKGIGRYLELKEKKRKYERELKEREKELFGYSEKYDRREVHKTVPQPFNLSKCSCKGTDQKLHTFQPETNEGKNKKFLRNLASEASKQMPEEYIMGIYN